MKLKNKYSKQKKKNIYIYIYKSNQKFEDQI